MLQTGLGSKLIDGQANESVSFLELALRLTPPEVTSGHLERGFAMVYSRIVTCCDSIRTRGTSNRKQANCGVYNTT